MNLTPDREPLHARKPHVTAEYVRALLAARKAWQRRYVRSARLSLGRESRDHTPPGITEPRTAVLCGSDGQPRWDVGVQSANRNRLCHLWEGQVKQPNPGSALEAVDVCELAIW